MCEFTKSGIKSNLKKVCHPCSHRDTYFDESEIYGGSKKMATYVVIGCKHEKVCKAYIESED